MNAPSAGIHKTLEHALPTGSRARTLRLIHSTLVRRLPAFLLLLVPQFTGASFGNWKLCDNPVECAILSAFFFSPAAWPLSAIVSVFVCRWFNRKTNDVRWLLAGLLISVPSYLLAIFTVVALHEIIYVREHDFWVFNLVTFPAALLLFVIPAAWWQARWARRKAQQPGSSAG